MKKISLLFAITLLTASSTSFGYLPDNVIYGVDNRKEVSQVTNFKIKEQTNSVAIMVRNTRLNPLDNTSYSYNSNSLQNAMNLCPDERFSAQPVLGECTGFIVSPDTLVTAGHCITSQSDCDQYSWVFNFDSQTNGSIKKEKVYKCQSVVKTSQTKSNSSFEDYAIIKLDRPVSGATPLKIRQKGKAAASTKLYVIGHPDGIPMKVTSGAQIRPFIRINFENRDTFFIEKHDYFDHRKDVFVANLDTFAGNSGSPVFNAKTGIVEGILVEGEDDYNFDMNSGCMRPNKLSNQSYQEGEIVQRITKLPKKKLK